MNGMNQIQTTQTLTDTQLANMPGFRGMDSPLYNGLFWLFAVGIVGIVVYLRRNNPDK
ncbi:MAG: hypothetical protein ACRCTE_01665 [Cellulosilyticaceae bacterium]